MKKKRNDVVQGKNAQKKRSIQGRNAKDITAKLFFRKPEIAADIYNACLFSGKQVVTASDMKEAPTELPSVITMPDGELGASTRLNDIVHVCATYVNEDISCIYMCLEAQSTQDRIMVLRGLEQVLRRYMKQVDMGDFKNANWKLTPVLVFLINFSDRPWKYPLEFRELFGELPKEIRPFIPQFRLVIIDPYTMSRKKRSLFCTEMNPVVNSFCFSDDPHRLPRTLKNPKGDSLSLEAVNLLKAYKNINIPVRETQGRSEMCKGWDLYEQGLRNQGFEKGMKKGIQQGKREGIQQGMEKGIQQGKREGIQQGKREGITRIVSRMLAMRMSIADIAKISGLRPGEISQIEKQMTTLQEA